MVIKKGKAFQGFSVEERRKFMKTQMGICGIPYKRCYKRAGTLVIYEVLAQWFNPYILERGKG